MNRRLTAALLALLMAGSLAVPAQAEEEKEEPKQVEVTLDGALTEVTGFLYGWTSYLPFSETVTLFRPDAAITEADGLYTAEGEDFTLTARAGECYIVVNDRYLYVADNVKEREEDGMPLVPARIIATALGAGVGWSGKVDFTAATGPLKAEDRPYTDEELDLVARVIAHEAGYESFLGKLAVGSVIVGRVKDSRFPDTVSGVIYQKNQFPGATNATPGESSILAARLTLEGTNVVPGAYWVNGKGKACWASRKKDLLYTIGNHAFYG